jgi:hypothetical protein
MNKKHIDDESLLKHWELASNDISQILDNMEERENWTLDNDEGIKQKVLQWANRVGGDISIESIEDNFPDFIKLISFVKSKRAFFIIKRIEDQFPGIIADTLRTSIDAISEKNDSTDIRHFIIHRDRLTALYRVELLERIYSDSRSETIKLSMAETVEKFGGIYEN